MNPTSIIKAYPTFKRLHPVNNQSYLEIAEFYADTIQGENFVGFPAAFLRLQGCTLNCHYCDTSSVWREGNPYTIGELLRLMEDADLPRKFKEGQHLILTGGSPLRQQKNLLRFVEEFIRRYQFKPFIEIENECTLMPWEDFIPYVDVWNNSPKLQSSGNHVQQRYHPEIIKRTASLPNSWFKFVIFDKNEWYEIEEAFLKPELIRREQIVLMPLGATREQLEQNSDRVVELAIEKNVRYTSREHIRLWDKMTGI